MPESQGGADRRHEYRRPQRPDVLADEDGGLTAARVRQADGKSIAMTASGPPLAASSTSSPIPVAAYALSIPSDRAIPIHPDLHASTPSTRQPLTATSWPAPYCRATRSYLEDARATSPKEPTLPRAKDRCRR
jgi:hypothetical protein